MPDTNVVHRVPRARVVDRVPHVLGLARGKRVVHLGFVDEGRMATKQARATWLHQPLAEVARQLVGIDVVESGVERARELGYEAHVADAQSTDSLRALGLEPAELVVAGEILEHLDAPGAFLDALPVLLAPGGRLVVTTPNGFSLTNFVAAIARRELVNVDHVGWYSWRTLQTLLGRHGWELEELAYYAAPLLRPDRELSARERVTVAGYNAFRRVARGPLMLWPSLADGLIVTARRAPAARATGG